jgi:Ni,Fe-hydrogenase III large subunit
VSVERKDVADRQLDALLERLDRLVAELQRMNRRLENDESMLRVAKELSTLNESLQALAYAALGTHAPSVRRRRAG